MSLVETHTKPVFILFLDVPLEIVDVNVHPRKAYVNFVDKKMNFETVLQAISATLRKNNITFNPARWKKDPLYDACLKSSLRQKQE